MTSETTPRRGTTAPADTTSDTARTDAPHVRQDRNVDVRDDQPPVRRDIDVRDDERSGALTVTGIDSARGGLSLWSVLSGMLVAFGAFIVISAIVSGILAATGIAEGGISVDEATTAGILAAAGLVVTQFLAYLWGGYTAGRMARGSGVLNGVLVPIVAIVLVVLLGTIVAALVGDVQTPSVQELLPLPLSTARDIGTGIGIGLLVAMLLGGALGGMLGARWHSKLEDDKAATHRAA